MYILRKKRERDTLVNIEEVFPCQQEPPAAVAGTWSALGDQQQLLVQRQIDANPELDSGEVHGLYSLPSHSSQTPDTRSPVSSVLGRAVSAPSQR